MLSQTLKLSRSTFWLAEKRVCSHEITYLISYIAGNHIFSLPILGDVWLRSVSTEKKTSKHHEKIREKSSIPKNQDTIEQNIIHLTINSFLCTYLYKYPPGNLHIPREF